VQKLSAEAYKEQMAVHGKTLTALGSYWKGRKPLILNKACILGCLLPATDDPARDLEVFEKLMAMDDESFVVRWKRRPKPKEILAELSVGRIGAYFAVDPPASCPSRRRWIGRTRPMLTHLCHPHPACRAFSMS
jgi:putative DNA methylase